jgi:hypothetical protein
MAVRRESVVLDLDDRFTSGMVKAAGATELLSKSLGNLDGKAVGSSRSTSKVSKDVDSMGNSASKAEKSIDKFSGRLSLLVSAAGAVGPALIPIGAVGIPAVAGLASEMGFAAVGAGSMVLAFQGVGDALTKLNKAQLEPTAANIAAARLAFEKIGPAAGEFVVHLDSMLPRLKSVRDAAAAGIFPGFTDGLDEAIKVLPRVRGIMSAVSQTVGDLGREAGTSLASDKWRPFLAFIEQEAPHAIAELSHTAGNLAHGMAQLWMAFTPLNNDFSSWLLDVSRSFDQWATQLSGTNGFQEFVDYIRQMAPQVGQTLAAVGDALLQIVEAAAPLGGPVLQVLESVAKVVAAIADSPLGPPIMALATALSSLRLAQQGWGKISETSFGSKAIASVKSYDAALASVATTQERVSLTMGRLKSIPAGTALKGAALAGGIGLVASGLADKFHAGETASLALTGAMVGGVGGAVAGGLVGAFIDASSGARKTAESVDSLASSFRQAVSAGDMAALAQVTQQAGDQLTSVSAQFDKLNADVQNNSFGSQLGSMFDPQEIANTWTGNFGTSNLESLAQSRDRLMEIEKEAKKTQGTLSALGYSLGATGQNGVDMWTRTLERAKPAMDALHIGIDNLNAADPTQFAAYTRAIQGWLEHADSTAGKTSAVGKAFADLDSKMASTADQAETLKNALDELLGPGLNLSAATDQWNAALRDLDKNLAEHTRSLTANTAGADKNREAVRGLVTDLEGVTNALAQKGKTAEAAKTFAEGRAQIIKFGTAAGLSRHQLERFLTSLGLTPKLTTTTLKAIGFSKAQIDAYHLKGLLDKLPPKVQTAIKADGIPKTAADVDALKKKYDLTPRQVATLLTLKDDAAVAGIKNVDQLLRVLNGKKATPKVDVDTGAARNAIDGIAGALNGLDGKRADTFIYTHHVDLRGSSQSQQELRQADGGYITGPGGPRDDRIPAWLSNGEFVVNAAATARNLDLLHRINAQKFADGGMARSDTYARRYMGASGASSQRMQVNFADLNFTATVRPGGGIDLVGMARAVARQEIDAHESWKSSQGMS